MIPTGAVQPVEGTGFDFRTPKRLFDGPEMLDHNFCLDGGRTPQPRPVATVRGGGVELELSTTERGLQVYDGALFDGTIIGLDGQGIAAYGGIAFEPQEWPDAPNQKDFPATLLGAGDAYAHESVYRFRRV